MKNAVIAWSILIALSLIWGSSFLFIKLALYDYDENVRLTADQLGALRTCLAGLALTPLIPFRSLYKYKSKFHYLFAAGLMGTGIPAFLFAYAEVDMSSALTGMLNATVPIWTVLSGFLFYKKMISLKELVGLMTGTIGVLILTEVWQINLAHFQLIPISLALAGSFCYAMNLNIIKYNLPDLDTSAITSISVILLFPFCLSFLIYDGFFSSLSTNTKMTEGIWPVLFLSFVGTAFALWLLNRIIKLTTPLFSSTVTYFIPIVAMFLGIAYGEKVSLIQFLGMGIMLIGVFVMSYKRKKKKS